MTEDELEKSGLPPPFWAFAWAGGQALSRYILDNPDIVRGKSVLDFGAGSGLIGIAAAKAGAKNVLSADIDNFAVEAIRINAASNGVDVQATPEDLVGVENRGWEVILVGDMCYERPLAERIETWLRRLAGEGVTVLIGDPGRTYLPKSGLEKLISYAVMTTRELEDTDVRNTSVWRVLPG
ncbi:MAG: 50S ribosomal protein L11 methyltransferase [Pseudomonadota bacterium]